MCGWRIYDGGGVEKLFCKEKWPGISPIVNIIMKMGYNKLRNA